jgi:hypothetical protein
MARANRKGGGGCKGRFKPKKMGKGWLTNRKVAVGSRPVLRITEPVEAKTEESPKSEG